MKEAIYFSKVEYTEYLVHSNRPISIMLLNIPEQELSYQTYHWKRQMPAIEGEETVRIGDFQLKNRIEKPARSIRNAKLGFVSTTIVDEEYEPEVIDSYGIRLTDEQIKELLPYCNAIDFEPYRDKKMSMDDEGYVGYRDELQLHFRAITDSYIPLLELPMDYYYDEKHIWPNEKLYRYLVKTFLEGNKRIKGNRPYYGAGSLFM